MLHRVVVGWMISVGFKQRGDLGIPACPSFKRHRPDLVVKIRASRWFATLHRNDPSRLEGIIRKGELQRVSGRQLGDDTEIGESASHSRSLVQRRFICPPLTAIAMAFFWPTRTTSFLPLVTAV
jgi:hypothetical protein